MAELRHIFRWDLDKTYLRTEFETLRGLVRSALEKAERKQAVPGAAELLRQIRAAGGSPEAHRICFISGSPRQMRRVLEQKLRLDGVDFDEFILKPNMSNLLRGRFRALREQVGYKLPALLAGRVGVPVTVGETLFGDDAEGDAFIYSLYADIVRGTADRELVEQVLVRARAYPDTIAHTLSLVDSVQKCECVRRVFIHLDGRSPPARFDPYGSRVVPFYNYFQAAAVLYQDGVLPAVGLVSVTLDMIERGSYTLDMLSNTYQDLVRRGLVQSQVTERLGQEIERAAPLAQAGAAATDIRAMVEALGKRIRALGDLSVDPPRTENAIDYLAALDVDLTRRRARSRRPARAPRI